MIVKKDGVMVKKKGVLTRTRVLGVASNGIMSLPVGELMFVRQVSIMSNQGIKSTGVLAVFVPNPETLVLQVMAQDLERKENQGASMFHSTFGAPAAAQSLSGDQSESTALETLAGLLDDSTQCDSNSRGSFRWSCRQQGSTLDVLVQEQKSKELVLNRWKSKIPQSESSTVLSFTLSLMQVIHRLEARADEMKSEMEVVVADRDDCLDKMNALSGKWGQEKSEMVHSFLELYKESQAAEGERAQERAKEYRSAIGAAAQSVQRTRGDRIPKRLPGTSRLETSNHFSGHHSSREIVSPIYGSRQHPRSASRRLAAAAKGTSKKRSREVTGDNISSSEESEADEKDEEVDARDGDDKILADDSSTSTSSSATPVARSVPKAKSSESAPQIANDSGSETDVDL